MRVPPQWPTGIPQHCPIAIVGEAPGEHEVTQGVPFVGPTGQELNSQLLAAGINREECLLTNVISERPPENNLAAFCVRKDELPDGYPLHIGPMVTHSGNLYLHPDRLSEGARLRGELEVARPNIIVALGATACWALLGSTSIGSLRGVVHRSVTSTPYKVLPTWHPGSVVRQYAQRPIAIADLVKAKREAASPAINYDNAELWLQPTLDDLYEFERRFMRGPHLTAPDVETSGGEITCIGFAPDPHHAIVAPFRTQPRRFKREGASEPITVYTGNYWPTPYEEKMAWLWVKRVMENKRVEKVGQNFMYDMQYILRYGIRPGLAALARAERWAASFCWR